MQLLDDIFYETKLRALPGGWNFDTIGNLFEIKQGKSLSRREQTGKQRKPFLRTANVLWGRLDLKDLDEMDFSPTECEALTLQSGDLLVCEGGDIGRTAVWRNELAECYYQNHLHRLRARNRRVNPYFMMFWMQAAITQLRVYEGFGNKTTIPNLSQSRLSQFVIPVPDYSEQTKIAAVLWKVQQAVETEAAIVRNARDLKKSLLRRLFTHGLRGESLKETELGPLPESWKVVQLAEIREFLQYGTSERCELAAKGLPVLRIPNVIGGKIDTSELKYADLRGSVAKNLSLTDGDLVFVRTNGQREYVGRSAVYKGQPEGALFASYLIRARLMKDRVNPDFLQAYTMTDNGRSFLSGRSHGAADGKFNINTETINSMLVPLPSLDEQREIAGILQSVDAKIAVHEAKQRALKDLFKTLLHQLMTAQLRVNHLDIDTSEADV